MMDTKTQNVLLAVSGLVLGEWDEDEAPLHFAAAEAVKAIGRDFYTLVFGPASGHKSQRDAHEACSVATGIALVHLGLDTDPAAIDGAVAHAINEVGQRLGQPPLTQEQAFTVTDLMKGDLEAHVQKNPLVAISLGLYGSLATESFLSLRSDAAKAERSQ